MTLADLIYDKFIEFLKEQGCYEEFDRLLNQRDRPDLSDKLYIYSRISKNMVDSLISWDMSVDWSSIDDIWRKKYTDILFSARIMNLDPIEIYRIKRTKMSEKIINVLAETRRFSHYYTCDSYIKASKYTKYDEDYIYLSNISDYLLVATDDVLRASLKIRTISDINTFAYISESFEELCSGYKPSLLATICEFKFGREFNYLDVSKDGKITYLPVDKIRRVHYTKYYTSSLRRETTIGRFLNKFYKDKFDKCEIEAISNYVTGCFGPLNIEIWNSDRIKEAYLVDNYATPGTCTNSVLHNSCMRHKKCQEFMNFYEAAGAKIAVSLVNGKISGRALLWKVGEDLYFLDRIYTINPFIITKFVDGVLSKVNIEYYRKDGTFYHAKSRHKLENPSPINKYVIQSDKLKMYKGPFPYVDTFFIYDHVAGTLTFNRLRILHSTDGEFSLV